MIYCEYDANPQDALIFKPRGGERGLCLEIGAQKPIHTIRLALDIPKRTAQLFMAGRIGLNVTANGNAKRETLFYN